MTKERGVRRVLGITGRHEVYRSSDSDQIGIHGLFGLDNIFTECRRHRGRGGGVFLTTQSSSARCPCYHVVSLCRLLLPSLPRPGRSILRNAGIPCDHGAVFGHGMVRSPAEVPSGYPSPARPFGLALRLQRLYRVALRYSGVLDYI